MFYGHRTLLSLASLATLAGAWTTVGCSRTLGLGTDVIWSDDFESGTFAAWSPNGAISAGIYGSLHDSNAGNPPVISTIHHGGGQYSARLTIPANQSDPNPQSQDESGLFVASNQFPPEAYYSVWYYIDQPYTTITEWDILKFQGVPYPDAGPTGGLSQFISLSLRSAPDGSLLLVLSDAEHQYLESPLPDPPAIVPVGSWFQIECQFRNIDDASGGLTIWLNGVQVYNVTRSIGPSPWVYFSPCSFAYDVTPSPVNLYVDDVIVSWTRITPSGVARIP